MTGAIRGVATILAGLAGGLVPIALFCPVFRARGAPLHLRPGDLVLAGLSALLAGAWFGSLQRRPAWIGAVGGALVLIGTVGVASAVACSPLVLIPHEVAAVLSGLSTCLLLGAACLSPPVSGQEHRS